MTLCSLTLIIAAAIALFAHAVNAAEEADFVKQIGPLLAKRCAGCHDAAEKKGGLDLTQRATMLTGGDSGAAIVPGDVEKSLVWQRIAADEMPPKHPLAPAERTLLKDWIARGAPWSGGTLDPLAYTSDQRAGYDWWSLQPVRQVEVPPSSPRAVNAIDAFVEQRLAAAKLAPSPPADPRTLIRRLYFDLIGLPPTVEELSEWEEKLKAESRKPGDASLRDSAAFSSLLSALLSSPQYGERWARHWLDVARFGESQGFERDKLRTNSWRYRDWVIDALNRDLPFDEFARLQLAGDVLKPDDPHALIATGFLVAAPWDEVGHKQQSAAMRAVVRQDELEDLVGTVGQTFLGLTVNCSRCHDHKFDPIRQREYYQLCAALAGVRHGEPVLSQVPADSTAKLRAPIEARLTSVQPRLDAIETPHRDQIVAARRIKRERLPPPLPFAAWDFKQGAKDTVGELDLELLPGAYIRNGMLLLEGEGYAMSPPLKKSLREKTLEVSVQLSDLDQRGGAAISLETLSGHRFDAIVYGEREPRRWFPGSDGFTRSQSVGGPSEEAVRTFVRMAISYQADGTVTVYREGQPYGKSYKNKELQTFSADTAHVLLGLRHSPAQSGRRLKCAIKLARLYDRALSADEVAAAAGVDSTSVAETDLIGKMTELERTERDNLRFERDQLTEALERLADRKTYAVAAQSPEPTHVLHRGNPNDPREIVAAGGIASLRGESASLGPLKPDASDAERRRWLAEWITSRDNPLFARVIVNRLWHYHFGVGLVDTPNDFGFNGGRPSHPELLDWLAQELMTHNWSLKHLHRQIVMSATYQQSSLWQAAAAKVDAGNRLLWRKSPQRLEAETLRDTMLRLSGALNETQGGPGFYEFTTFVHNSQFYTMRDGIGPTFDRRTIYRTWVRSARSQLLDVFDCPDPSTKAPQRAVTTTPLQALSLSNNAFVLRLADTFAERVRREVGRDSDQQVLRVFQHAFGRVPHGEELSACVALVEKHGLPALCRVVFNSNELLYVD